MELKELVENQIVNCKDKDLQIRCDIPMGVVINITDGNLEIHGNVGKDVKINATHIPQVDIQHNGGYFTSDSIYVQGMDIQSSGMRMNQAFLGRGHLIVGGKEFPLPKSPKPLTANIKIHGTIAPTADIRTTRKMIIIHNGNKMAVLSPDDKISAKHYEFFCNLNDDAEPNLELFKKLLQQFPIEQETAIEILTSNLPKLKTLLLENKAALKSIIKYKGDFDETALSILLEQGDVQSVEILLKNGFKPEEHRDDDFSFVESMEACAKQGNCLKEYTRLLEKYNKNKQNAIQNNLNFLDEENKEANMLTSYQDHKNEHNLQFVSNKDSMHDALLLELFRVYHPKQERDLFYESIGRRQYGQAARRICTQKNDKLALAIVKIMSQYQEKLNFKINEKNKDGKRCIDYARQNNLTKTLKYMKNALEFRQFTL